MALVARIAGGQSGVTVSGLVRDSIGHHQLSGAVVQLVSADTGRRFTRTVDSDSLGRFSIPDVPPGQYLLGFFHPLLDSLGMEPPARLVRVDAQPVRADLSTPSAAQLREAICGPGNAGPRAAAVIGVVHSARDGAAVSNAQVVGQWVELTLGRDGLSRAIPRVAVSTNAKGWFAICDVPGAGPIALTARLAADSTDRIEVEIPSDGLLHRELFLGGGASGRLHGTVVAADGAAAVAGARVGILGGPETRTNERGEWTLVDAPTGTRMLDVRAITYYPDRRPVDVLANDESVHITLSSLQSVLDTVKVRSTRRADADDAGFQMRRRSGGGDYITPEDVARRSPIVTSDLFKNAPGVLYDAHRSDSVYVRGLTADRCVPSFYINGQLFRHLSADDIDGWVQPDEIAGIEVYGATSTPAQFTDPLDHCGAIVIWTKPGSRSSPRLTFRQYGSIALGLATIVFLLTRAF
jgi:hypothetical protein